MLGKIIDGNREAITKIEEVLKNISAIRGNEK